MNIHSKARISVSALVYIASVTPPRTVALSEVAEHINCSVSYLEQIFGQLRAKRIVKSFRGPGGGYRIARPLDEIFISELVEVVDYAESSGRKDGLDAPISVINKHPLAEQVWMRANRAAFRYLSTVTLASLVESSSLGDDGPAPARLTPLE